MTDEALVYERLGREFAGHGTVNHSTDEYVHTGGFHHTKTVESFFALSKHAVYGQFHHVSEAHLHRHLAEADFKYNHRSALGIDDVDRAAALLRAALRASGFYTDSLTTPRTSKQVGSRSPETKDFHVLMPRKSGAWCMS
jgi:hypothetical protein